MSDRDEFEAWAKERGLSLARFDNTSSERHGEYFMAETRGAWCGWQSARRWRPIEEAPWDGTTVLVCGGTYHCDDVSIEISSAPLMVPVLAEWDHIETRFECPNDGNLWYQPAHFQYLPEPPNE